MNYSIGEVSKMTGISIPTLRYYDKEGLFSNIARTEGNIRLFSDADLLTIKWINCLKLAGMTLKEVKEYLDMNTIGDSTLDSRLELFTKREQAIFEQMKELEQTMAMVQIKKWWYITALEMGSEEKVRNLSPNDYPKDIYNKFVLAFGEDFDK